MTKYEEIDIENMTQADIRNVIMEGDRISVEVDGVDGLLVRTVEKVANGSLRIRFYSHLVKPVEVLAKNGMSVTRIERPIPEVELPTVPGYYESAKYPLGDGWYAYRLRKSGSWCNNVGTDLPEALIHKLMPLTRLVPEATPAKLADRIDAAKLGGRMRSLFHGDGVWAEDAEALIAAIDNGELDK